MQGDDLDIEQAVRKRERQGKKEGRKARRDRRRKGEEKEGRERERGDSPGKLTVSAVNIRAVAIPNVQHQVLSALLT